MATLVCLSANPVAADPFEGYPPGTSGQLEQRVNTDIITGKSEHTVVLKAATPVGNNDDKLWIFGVTSSRTYELNYCGIEYSSKVGDVNFTIGLESDFKQTIPTLYGTIPLQQKRSMLDVAINCSDGRINGFGDYMLDLGKGFYSGLRQNFGQNTDLSGFVGKYSKNGFTSLSFSKNEIRIKYAINIGGR